MFTIFTQTFRSLLAYWASLNEVFLKIYQYDPTSKFQEYEIGSDLTFMQSKVKICKTDFFAN